MANWDLSEIRTKTRQLSGRTSLSELNNNQLDEYINKYLQYEFPAEVKLNRNYTYYEFTTLYHQQLYDFPTNYTNFVPEAYVDNLNTLFYQDPDKFEAENPQNVQRFTTWTGDGATTGFTNTFSSNVPIQKESVVIDDTVEVFTDNGLGVLTGNQGGTGTVDYETGAISVTFNTAPISGQGIYASFVQQITGKPTAILMYNNQFKMYPVPDRAYRIRLKAWTLELVRPASGANQETFINATDRPLLDEWGPCIAFGTARRIVSDFGELDQYAMLTPLYKEQVDYILTRTHIDLESTRALPMF